MKEKRHFYINILSEKLADLLEATRPTVVVDDKPSDMAKLLAVKFWELDLNKTTDTAETYDKYLTVQGTETEDPIKTNNAVSVLGCMTALFFVLSGMKTEKEIKKTQDKAQLKKDCWEGFVLWVDEEEEIQKINGVLKIDKRFIQILNKPLSETDIKGFYLAHQYDYLQFRGLINGLGAKQAQEDAFFEKLKNSFYNSTKTLIGQVIGSGGTGKTTFLRQIALRWTAEIGNPVFWIGREDYENIDLPLLAEQIPTEALLVVDEAEQNADFLKKMFAKMPNHRFMSASRKFPKALLHWANANEYNMDMLDLTSHNQKILTKLAQFLPLSQHLNNASLTQIKPFPLLFVLLRSLETGKDLSQIEDVARDFSEIIQHDLELLEATKLAPALRTFAYIFKKYQTDITNLAFADLAPEAHIGDTPAKTDKILAYYLGVFVNEKDKQQKIKETFWSFHKEDLAEEIEKNLNLQEKLACEKHAEQLLASKSQRTASKMLWNLGKHQQKDIVFLRMQVETFLKKQNPHLYYTSF